MERVIIETPFKGNNYENTEENLRFARACGHDCFSRGEAFFASHLLYTQYGVLDDKISEERALGIEGGFAWKDVADATVVYVNRGISKGMQAGIKRTIKIGQRFEYRSLANYPKTIPVIFTITGASGVGKSTIVKRFLEIRPKAALIKSFTTRGLRESDLPGEYECNVSGKEFVINFNNFLWVVEIHGNVYGTPKKAVDDALLGEDPRFMILVPGAVRLLREHISIATKHLENKIVSFYVLSPGEEELQRRLSIRGEGEIQRRIGDCKRLDEKVLESDTPYIFLKNDEPEIGIEKAARQMEVFL